MDASLIALRLVYLIKGFRFYRKSRACSAYMACFLKTLPWASVPVLLK